MPVEIETWIDNSSNQQQQYLTHGAFRYFGKLPPTVTGRILDELDVRPDHAVVDVMCGSGTTLVEAGIRGADATGVDANDVSVLISRVKTTPVAERALREMNAAFVSEFSPLLDVPLVTSEAFGSGLDRLGPATFTAPEIRNIGHWFVPETVRALCRLRDWVDARPPGALQDLARVAFASSIRMCSRASVRTGRLFHDVDKEIPNPIPDFHKRLVKISDAVTELTRDQRWANARVAVQVGDARSTGLPSASFDTVFCHPPYFALYRYSSDVLRFEMEWSGVSRKAVLGREIEDGFKTTDETLVEDYVRDLVAVAVEARRLAKPNGHLVFITADSTLRKQALAVLEPLIAGATEAGWTLDRRARRKVRFAQASYHKSADSEITRPDDEIVMFSLRG